MRELSLFTGVGGGLLGSVLLGWRTVVAVEIDPYCQRLLCTRGGYMADAERPYRFWRDKGAERADLLTAARIYRDHCTATDCKMQHARTFLAKPPKGARARWYEWAEGEQHGSMDARGDRRLMDVMTTAAEAFGLNGGNDNGNGGRKALGGGPARAAEGCSDVGGGMAARELGAGE